MRKYTLVLLLAAFCLSATAQQKRTATDSVSRLVQINFNQKNADGLYELTGEGFRKAITADKFREISNGNLFPLGNLNTVEFEKETAGVSAYKAVFDNMTFSLLLSLDDKNKLSTFLFKEYVPPADLRKEKVRSDNPLLSEQDKTVDRLAQAYLVNSATAGLSIGILKNGKAYYYNYGEAEKGKQNLPDSNTVFEIGSITKTFAATLLADAVNNKKLKLDDPASKYFPGSALPATITLRMLANHTSGLPRMPDNINPSNPQDPYREYDLAMLQQFLRTVVLTNPPGTKYEYSNLGMAMIGAVLEQVHKKEFSKLVQEKITGPLALQRTGLLSTTNEAQGYDESGKATSHWNFKIFAAAGALRSSTADMLKYANAQMGAAPAVLKKAIDLTHDVTYSSKNSKMGLGWHLVPTDKGEFIFHNGGTGGFRTYLAIDKNKKLAVTLLSNSAVAVDNTGHQLLEWMMEN